MHNRKFKLKENNSKEALIYDIDVINVNVKTENLYC